MLALSALLALAGEQRANPTASVALLLVTGNSHPAHNWRATAPVVRQVLEHESAFAVDVSENVGILGSPAIRRYRGIVLDYDDTNHPGLSAPGRRNFAAYLRDGGGLVVIHWASGAFRDWDEWPKMIGRRWGRSSGHDPYGPFRVEIADPAHPITRGLERFETRDELYFRLEGDTPIHVVARARSHLTGELAPIAFTVTYGQGRCFHLALGHDSAARQNPGFQQLLLRGTAWAAGIR